MKILHVIHSVNPKGGGPIEGIKQLASALAKLKVTAEVMSLDSPDAPWTKNFPFKLYLNGPSFLGYGYTPRAIPWLRQNCANYDAVIVHGLWQYSGFAVWQVLRNSPIPYYVYTHGMLDPWFKRRYPLKHLKKCLYWPWAEYRILRDATAVLFTSEEERIVARQSFRFYRCREQVTGYGISAPGGDIALQRELFFARYPDLIGKRLILYLGRIHEKKGCDLLLRAWKEVCPAPGAGSNAQLHLVMAGPDDHAYGNSMKKLARDLGIASQVTWTGMVTGDMKWGCLGAAEVFVLPSHQENFGISVVEALVLGVPVLISNQVNIWREILEDKAGLVENDDLKGTVQLLKRWVSLTPEQIVQMQAQARDCFKKRFDIARTAEKLALLLRR